MNDGRLTAKSWRGSLESGMTTNIDAPVSMQAPNVYFQPLASVAFTGTLTSEQKYT